jgi:adenine-specific DNA-methyltransferase
MNASLQHFLAARNQARRLAAQQENPSCFARRFLAGILTAYRPSLDTPPVKPLAHPLAIKMGFLAQSLDMEMAAYLVGTTYTVMLPDDYRGQYGVFYTPPALVERLLDLAEQSGVDWSCARVLDPACGGGAFLAPVARRMMASLSHLPPETRLAHIETHLQGFEIDPFSAWVSTVFVTLLLKDDITAAGRPLAELVQVGDSLRTPESFYNHFDLVVGNPPYGRIKLSEKERSKWSRSLYGHANRYGLFCDLAARLIAPGGSIAYVTPTSFLGGQYFQSLRTVLASETPPVAIDFIADREAVFADALQETLLAVYKKQKEVGGRMAISSLTLKETGAVEIVANGHYTLSDSPEKPWILPRTPDQSRLATICHSLPYRLADLGYCVATGPLVWNRHKERLFADKVKGAIPLIWAECVEPSGSGIFTFKATGRNHVPWFKPARENDPNIVRSACVLLQRTTALEQSRRLIAAELPQSFIDTNGGRVTVENHLNMVRPLPGREPLVSASAIAALLNSETVDRIFRCINGSAAVSAYELESMPLPSPEVCGRLEALIEKGAGKNVLERAIKEMYDDFRIRAAA